MDMESGLFDYVAGFEVRSAENVPEDMVTFEVPGGRDAVFTTPLGYLALQIQSLRDLVGVGAAH